MVLTLPLPRPVLNTSNSFLLQKTFLMKNRDQDKSNAYYVFLPTERDFWASLLGNVGIFYIHNWILTNYNTF